MVVTNVLVRPAYSLSETIMLCNGESYTFPDGTVQNNITSPFTHTSNLTSVSGCGSIIVTNINVYTVDASVVQDGSSLKAVLIGATYQWIDANNDLLQGETNQDFIATKNGSYAVIVSDKACSATSDFYTVTIQGIGDNQFENQIIVYPNPVSNKVTLDFPSIYNSVQIQIVNLNNQIMNTHSFANVQKVIELDVREFKSGIYMIRVSADNNEALLKIVKE
jgi:beta-galactosidase